MNVASGLSSVTVTTRFARILRGVLNPADCRTPGAFAAYVAFVGGFAAILSYFSFVDVYDNHFFQSGYSAIYNAFRVAFIVYLFWLVSFIGRTALAHVAGRAALDDTPVHERLALGFFVGGAIVTVVMLVLGYLYLYWRVVAALIAIPLVAASWRDFVLTARETRSSITRFVRESSSLHLVLSVAMVLAVVFLGAVLLLVKGLYPQGGHDYYQHYQQFYSLVVDRHNIWPNDFWYHYYYSKGLGVTFLGMLLTDPLAPSLVAFCFVIATSLAVYSLVNRFCPRTLWPLATLALYLALSVHTLGTGFYAANGGWGHFQKPHEINAAILIGILWMAVGMVRSTGDARRVWRLGAASCSFIVAYLLIISSAIVGLFALLATGAFFFADRSNAKAFFGLAIAAGFGLTSVFVLNYVTTSIPSDIGLNIWWPIINFRWLNEAGTLFDVTNVAYRRAEAVARGVSFENFDMLNFLRNAGRFDILGSWMYGAVAGIAILAAGRAVLRGRLAGRAVPLGASNVAASSVLLAYMAAIALFTIVIGSSEPVSYVRASSFALPLMAAVAAIAWQLATASVTWPWGSRGLFAYAVPVALACITILQAYDGQKLTLPTVVSNAVRFVDGRYSIYDAYKDQSGWPALPNATAIYPGMYEAWKTIGSGERLWSFNVHSYCMIPGCRVESHLSSKMSARRAEILYGSPDVAREVLQGEGLNNFFIATRLDIRDPLICTPLFSPDTIRDHLGVKWTDGVDALLTWKGPNVAPISEDWAEKYRAALKASPHTPDCSGNGPPFSYIGRRVHDDVMKGKRWGSEIVQPK